MRMPVYGRCWYCSGDDLELTDEHVLSEANFGGRLVARDRVCKPCNGRVGKLERAIVSGPFLAEFVGRDGPLFAPKGLPTPSAEGILADDSEVRVKFGPSGAKVEARIPRKVGEEGGDIEVWEVAAGQEELVRERREKAGAKVKVLGRAASDAPGLNVKWGIGTGNIDHWPRFGVKVALSLASLMLDSSWLDTPGARALQTVLAGGRHPKGVFPQDLMWGPSELDPDREPANLLRPGDHVLGLDPDPDDGPRAWMILFGGLAYEVPIPDADVPDWHPTWHLRPGAAAEGPVPGAQLQARLQQRVFVAPSP